MKTVEHLFEQTGQTIDDVARAAGLSVEHARLLDALKPGDKVVCAGGIHATVVGVTDATVQVRIADQVRVDVEKASISTVKRPD